MSWVTGLGTPLMKAAGAGHAEIVALLVRAGADTAAADSKGRVARDHALEGHHHEVAQQLSYMQAKLYWRKKTQGKALREA